MFERVIIILKCLRLGCYKKSRTSFGSAGPSGCAPVTSNIDTLDLVISLWNTVGMLKDTKIKSERPKKNWLTEKYEMRIKTINLLS